MVPPQFDSGFRDQLGLLFRWRRDVRRFSAEPVPDVLLDALLEIAALSPSVGLSEPWRFVVVSDGGKRRAVAAEFQRCNEAALRDQPADRTERYAALKLAGLDEAPVHLAVCVEREPAQGGGLGRRTMQETADYSAVMAIHTLWLAARSHGLGLGWVSIVEPAVVIALLGLPKHWVLIGYLCVGYPVEECDEPELQRSGWELRRPMPSKILRL